MAIAANEQATAADALALAPTSLYGDGSDGDVTIAGNTNLTRDMYYDNLTVNNAVVLDSKGYRIHVRKTLTNNGTIQRVGGDGADGDGSSYLFGGNNSGETGFGSSGGQSSPEDPDAGDNASSGGAGGDGGAGDSGAGAAGGAVTDTAMGIRAMPNASRIQSKTGAQLSAGGGGGGGNGWRIAGASLGGGGGGAGGGFLFISARIIANTSGIIQCNGGDGGDSYDDGNHEVGGGGGGGGGVVICVYKSATWGTEQATGGTGGTGKQGGGNGVNGSAGLVIKISNTED